LERTSSLKTVAGELAKYKSDLGAVQEVVSVEVSNQPAQE